MNRIATIAIAANSGLGVDDDPQGAGQACPNSGAATTDTSVEPSPTGTGSDDPVPFYLGTWALLLVCLVVLAATFGLSYLAVTLLR